MQAIFVVEMILKLLAFGPERYFRDAWNWIDFAVVCEGIISALLAIIKLAAPREYRARPPSLVLPLSVNLSPPMSFRRTSCRPEAGRGHDPHPGHVPSAEAAAVGAVPAAR